MVGEGADVVAIKEKPKGPAVSYTAPIAEQRALAKGGNLEGAIANLLQLEKTARLVNFSAPRRRTTATIFFGALPVSLLSLRRLPIWL